MKCFLSAMHMGAQHKFIMADNFKRISGGGGATPRSCEIFAIYKGIKIPKIA